MADGYEDNKKQAARDVNHLSPLLFYLYASKEAHAYFY